jgi:hypothetical protein
VEPNVTREDDSYSAGEEIPRLLCNARFSRVYAGHFSECFEPRSYPLSLSSILILYSKPSLKSGTFGESALDELNIIWE